MRSFALLTILFSWLLASCAPASPSAAALATAPGLSPSATAPSAYPDMQCTSVSAGQNRKYFERMPYAPLSTADWARGPADALITLLVYSDFQCPTCAAFAQTLAALQARYPEQLRVIFRPYPLLGSAEQPLNDKADLALNAAEAAGAQGAFWEMHDLLFAQQDTWAGLSREAFVAWLTEQAHTLALDAPAFASALEDPSALARAQAAWEQGQAQQLGTPPFLVTDAGPHGGPIDIDSLDVIIQLNLLAQRQFNRCPAMQLEPGVSYRATITTEHGDIVLELLPEVAPNAVNSFVFLARQGWFDDTSFHRVLPGFVAQAGDPSGTGYGGPGYAFGIETAPTLSFDRAGLLAMANAGPTSNGSQFFITYAPAEHLNGGYTIFGRVLQGMPIVDALAPRDPSQGLGLPPGDRILRVQIEEQ